MSDETTAPEDEVVDEVAPVDDEAEEDEVNPENYPSIDLAYDISIASYEVMRTRWDAMENRIQSHLSFVITVSLAVPVVASRTTLEIYSIWLLFAALSFAASVFTATYARLSEELRIQDPAQIFETALRETVWEFKKNVVFYAGQSLDKNVNSIDKKHGWLMSSNMLFFAEVIFLTVWILTTQ